MHVMIVDIDGNEYESISCSVNNRHRDDIISELMTEKDFLEIGFICVSQDFIFIETETGVQSIPRSRVKLLDFFVEK